MYQTLQRAPFIVLAIVIFAGIWLFARNLVPVPVTANPLTIVCGLGLLFAIFLATRTKK